MSDNITITLVCIAALFAVIILYYFAVAVIQVAKNERKFIGFRPWGIVKFILSVVLLTGFFYCLYNIPQSFFFGAPWYFIEVMGPSSLLWAVISISIVIPLFYLYFLFTSIFANPNEKPYFSIIILSIISGAGNSMVVFVINATLNQSLSVRNRSIGFDSGLYLYFILGILLFTITALIVRRKLIAFTSDLVYEKRMEIINKILKAPYYKLTSMEDGKIYAVLNNDTEAISSVVNMFVNGLTGLITLVTCLIYLGTLNFYGLIWSVLIIGFAVGLFMSVSDAVERLYEKNRDIQNLFFKYINDMVGGFKELYINRKKRAEFKEDIEKSCAMYRKTRVEGEYKLVGVSIIGEMLYIFVVGVVVFTFPLIFKNIQGNTLRTYVLVFLYMGGIVNTEIYLIPSLFRVLVSWRRITGFIKEISLLEREHLGEAPEHNVKDLRIEVNNVKFHFNGESGEQFTVGPINCEFKSGEIIYITGGNGSGKTTLGKLVTGLYEPDEGEILINGEKVDAEVLGNYYSTVFSDYYLFDRLYGIDYEAKREETGKYLELLHIQDKVRIKDGRFGTLKLSTGQRKRMALLISYLEDRPLLLFDEWAADQDPEFRQFFYRILLPGLKEKGKAIIAITHDDRYFDTADRIIKMEMGKIVDQKQINLSNNEQTA